MILFKQWAKHKHGGRQTLETQQDPEKSCNKILPLKKTLENSGNVIDTWKNLEITP